MILDNQAYLILAGFAVAAIWLASIVIRMRLAVREYSKRLVGREDLGKDVLYERFYSTSGLPKDDVWKILILLARSYKVSPGLLRPADSFQKELRPPESLGWPLGRDSARLFWAVKLIADSLQKEFPALTLDPRDLDTVNDLVRYFGNALQRAREQR